MYMDYFHQIIVLSEYGFCPMNDNQRIYPFSLQGTMRGPLSESDCSSEIVVLIASGNSEGSDELVHTRSPSRAFAARKPK